MLAINILTTFSARVAILMLALASSVMLARFLGPDGRGLFALVLLVPELARTFGLLGFEQANVVYAGLEPGKRKTLVWHSAMIAAAVGGAIAVVGISLLVFGFPGSQSLLRGPLWLYGLAFSVVPFALATEYLGAILRGMNRITILNVFEIGSKVASLILVILFVGLLRLEVAGAVWADVIANVSTIFVVIALLMYCGASGPPEFDWSLLRRTARFAVPAHCSTVMSYLNYRVDQFFIAALLAPDQLGYYVIAVGLAERLWIPTGAVANALLPHLTNSPERDPALPAIIARHIMIWIGAACFLVYFLADMVVTVLYSSDFAATVAPLCWLLPGVFALSIGRVLVAELLAREKPRYTVWASGVAAVINIAGNFLLVPSMGISGAALASSVSYSLLSLILIKCYLVETGLPWTVLLPRRTDLMFYLSLCQKAKTGIFVKLSRPARRVYELQYQAAGSGPTAVSVDLSPGTEPARSVKFIRSNSWRHRIREFLQNPHFPFFLLTPIRKLSPTLGRYLRYGRYNPNTESYWNERYRSGTYQKNEEWRYQVLDQEIVQMIPPKSRVLDAGCGTGRLMEKLRDQRLCSCVGIDMSEISVRMVQDKGFRAFKCKLPRLMPDLTRNSFDVCTVMETLEHLSNAEKTLQSLSTVLKDGGYFIVSVPNDCMTPDEFDEHVSSFNKQSLDDLLSRFCDVEVCYSIDAAGHDHLIMKGKKPVALVNASTPPIGLSANA